MTPKGAAGVQPSGRKSSADQCSLSWGAASEESAILQDARTSIARAACSSRTSVSLWSCPTFSGGLSNFVPVCSMSYLIVIIPHHPLLNFLKLEALLLKFLQDSMLPATWSAPPPSPCVTRRAFCNWFSPWPPAAPAPAAAGCDCGMWVPAMATASCGLLLSWIPLRIIWSYGASSRYPPRPWRFGSRRRSQGLRWQWRIWPCGMREELWTLASQAIPWHWPPFKVVGSNIKSLQIMSTSASQELRPLRPWMSTWGDWHP